MKIVILDAQGGGVGRKLIELLKKELPEQLLIAVGTNTAATTAMLKAGADQAATGENAVRVTTSDADLILAPIGMLLCDGMLGEVTPEMAMALGRAKAHKILIPSQRCGVSIAGTPEMAMGDYAAAAVSEAAAFVRKWG